MYMSKVLNGVWSICGPFMFKPYVEENDEKVMSLKDYHHPKTTITQRPPSPSITQRPPSPNFKDKSMLHYDNRQCEILPNKHALVLYQAIFYQTRLRVLCLLILFWNHSVSGRGVRPLYKRQVLIKCDSIWFLALRWSTMHAAVAAVQSSSYQECAFTLDRRLSSTMNLIARL